MFVILNNKLNSGQGSSRLIQLLNKFEFMNFDNIIA